MNKTEKGQKPEMVSINRDLYDKLLKLASYVQDWCPDYEECKNCGALHPKHTICIQCDYDNSTGKIRE